MFRRYWFLLFLSIACEPPPDCTTFCGLKVWGVCAGIQTYESRAIQTFGDRLEWDEVQMCKTLQEWELRRDDSILAQGHLGETWWDSNVILVATDELRWGAVGHELVHVYQHVLEHRTELDHASWKARGFYDAINEIAKKLPEDGKAVHPIN